MMDIKEIIKQMTFEEKAKLLAVSESMSTEAIARLGIPSKNLADGPHGVRVESGEGNCTSLPCLSALAATWDTEMAELYGETLTNECINRDIDMILGTGVNTKKNMLCGRNFEYFSEDPVLAGELSAS